MKSPQRLLVLAVLALTAFAGGCTAVTRAQLSCDSMSIHEPRERSVVDRQSCYYGVERLRVRAASTGFSIDAVDQARTDCRQAPSTINTRDCVIGVNTLRDAAIEESTTHVRTPTPRDQAPRPGRRTP